MTPDEQKMLNDLAAKVAQAPVPQRDAEAEEFIRTRIGARPDALYLLTQTVLIQNLAIEHAKQQIQELQQRAVQPAPTGGSSFLGGAAPQPGYGAPPPPPPQAPPSAPAFGGGGSFLRSAATTAAGVAAGALAFEGIRSMFGGLEHMAGFGGSNAGSGFLGGAPAGETIINNYYENPDPSAGDDGDDSQDDGGDADDANSSDDSADYSDDSGDDSSNDDLV